MIEEKQNVKYTYLIVKREITLDVVFNLSQYM